jgi:hypothetical protein
MRELMKAREKSSFFCLFST